MILVILLLGALVGVKKRQHDIVERKSVTVERPTATTTTTNREVFP